MADSLGAARVKATDSNQTTPEVKSAPSGKASMGQRVSPQELPNPSIAPLYSAADAERSRSSEQRASDFAGRMKEGKFADSEAITRQFQKALPPPPSKPIPPPKPSEARIKEMLESAARALPPTPQRGRSATEPTPTPPKAETPSRPRSTPNLSKPGEKDFAKSQFKTWYDERGLPEGQKVWQYFQEQSDQKTKKTEPQEASSPPPKNEPEEYSESTHVPLGAPPPPPDDEPEEYSESTHVPLGLPPEPPPEEDEEIAETIHEPSSQPPPPPPLPSASRPPPPPPPLPSASPPPPPPMPGPSARKIPTSQQEAPRSVPPRVKREPSNAALLKDIENFKGLRKSGPKEETTKPQSDFEKKLAARREVIKDEDVEEEEDNEFHDEFDDDIEIISSKSAEPKTAPPTTQQPTQTAPSAPKSPPTSKPDALLKQIREGKQLKKADTPKEPPKTKEAPDLTKSLNEQLEKFRQQLPKEDNDVWT